MHYFSFQVLLKDNLNDNYLLEKNTIQKLNFHHYSFFYNFIYCIKLDMTTSNIDEMMHKIYIYFHSFYK